MKNFLRTYILFAVVLMAFTACQVISDDNRYLPLGSQQHQSRALLLEFTGFKCLNCPNAAAEAHNLLEQYADSLVVVAIHPSQNNFCSSSNPLYDFSCAGGDSLYALLGGTSATPFPTGLVNMRGGFSDYTTWAASVEWAVCQPQLAQIHLTRSDDTDDRMLAVDYTLTTDKALSDLRLIFMVTEDGIIGPQRLPDGSDTEEYEHNHMLRHVMTIADVQPIGHAQWQVPLSYHQRDIQLDKCSMVAVVQDAQTGYVYDVERLTAR